MRDQKVSRIKRWFIDAGVKAGAWIAWSANSRHKAAGERRVIPAALTPDRAAITWKQIRNDIWGSSAPGTCEPGPIASRDPAR